VLPKKLRFGKGWERLPQAGIVKGVVYWLGKSKSPIWGLKIMVVIDSWSLFGGC